MDLLEEMTIFVEVAREGNQAAAARRLGKSPPTVTRRMKEFEKRFAFPLVDRSSAGFALTREGEECFRRAELILEGKNELLRLGTQPEVLSRAPLTVRCLAGMDSELFKPWFAEFGIDTGPQLRIHAEEPNEPYLGTPADVTIGFSAPAAGFIRVLGVEKMVFVASPRLSATLSQPSDFPEFAEYRFLWLNGQVVGAKWLLSRRSDYWAAVDLRPLGSGETVKFVLDVVLGGTGIGILPVWLVCDKLRTGELMRVFPKWSVKPPEPRVMRAYAQPHARAGTVAARFLDFAQRCWGRAESLAARGYTQPEVHRTKA